MYRIRRPQIAAILLLFVAARTSSAQENRETSAKLFGDYVALLQNGPLSKTDFDRIKPVLGKKGFSSTSDDIVWSMRDALGVVSIMAVPNAGHFEIRYTPLTPTFFGDAALAALIAKSSYVDVTDGDNILVHLRTEALNQNGHTGTKLQAIGFSLRGGMWLETGVDIQWER